MSVREKEVCKLTPLSTAILNKKKSGIINRHHLGSSYLSGYTKEDKVMSENIKIRLDVINNILRERSNKLMIKTSQKS